MKIKLDIGFANLRSAIISSDKERLILKKGDNDSNVLLIASKEFCSREFKRKTTKTKTVLKKNLPFLNITPGPSGIWVKLRGLTLSSIFHPSRRLKFSLLKIEKDAKKMKQLLNQLTHQT